MSNWISKLAVAVLVLFSLSACIEERVVIKVKKDGSGIVEHYSYNNVEGAMGGFLAGMMEQEGMEDASEHMDAKIKNEFDDAYFEKFAKDMGEGVKVKDYTLGSNEIGMKGYHAVYTFEDINKIAVKMRESMGDEGADQDLSGKQDALTSQPDFSMKDGELRIKIPHDFESSEDQKAAQAEAADSMEEMPPQMLGMMAAMFQGMRIAISIEGLDDIKDTNAHHRDGNTIVLSDIQMDKLIGDMESLQKLQKIDSLPRDEMQAMADATDGLVLDMQEEIVIKF